MNYQLTELVQDYIENHGTVYQTFNDVMGVLSSMQQEIYRRLVAPYEEIKISENGDVFPSKEEAHD